MAQPAARTSAATCGSRHVVARLHLDEPAHRARELPAVRPLAVEVVRAGRGGGQKLHAVIVQDVDEPSEAPRQVAHVGGHPRDAGQEQHGEAAGELEVVALRPRAVAQRREVEPGGAAGAAPRDERPPFDRELRILVRARRASPRTRAASAASASAPSGTCQVSTCSSARSR